MNLKNFVSNLKAANPRVSTLSAEHRAKVNAFNKRKAVDRVIKFFAETTIVDPKDTPKEQSEAIAFKSLFCELQPAVFTDAEIDELFTGFKNIFIKK